MSSEQRTIEQHYGKVYHMTCVNAQCRHEFDLDPDSERVCPRCQYPALVSAASDKALVEDAQ